MNAKMRVSGLWSVLGVWLIWYCFVLQPDTSGRHIVQTIRVSALVGIVLNTLNWHQFPMQGGDRLVWFLRVAGNFAVPFAVSLTSAVLA